MKLTPPVIHFNTPERYWDDAKEGDVCISPSYAVTEERINAYAVLTGDYTPVHIDEDYAKTTPFGTRVAHGLFGLSGSCQACLLVGPGTFYCPLRSMTYCTSSSP